VRHERLCLGGRFPVTGGKQAIAGFGEQVTAGLLGVNPRLSQPKQQPGPLGIVGRPQLQRGRIPADGGGERVEVKCPVARLP
jgi:hypothetical protein